MIVKSLLIAKMPKSFSSSNLMSLPLEEIGKRHGWMCRQARKITLGPFLLSLLHCISSGRFSYLWWALDYQSRFGYRPSRQAMFKRVNHALVNLIEELIGRLWENSSSSGPFATCDMFSPFKEVLLQDSTNFKLSDDLFEHFPGNYSLGKRKSMAKIDLIFDVKRWRIKQWNISSFCQNDQSRALSSLTNIQSGSLLIRDLGYLSLAALAQMNERSIHFLSRLKNGIGVYCPKSNKEIILSSFLPPDRAHSQLVLIGRKKIPVRLVSIPLSDTTVEYRRRKLSKDRDRRRNPSKESRRRLAWAIFITSVPEDIWSNQQVAQAYKVRWNIELIFKTWKSNSNVVKVLEQMKTVCSVRMILLSLLLFTIMILMPILNHIWAISGSERISWTKLAEFVFKGGSLGQNYLSFKELSFYAKYEKRKRPNIIDGLQQY